MSTNTTVWIAKDKDGEECMFEDAPRYVEGVWIEEPNSAYMILPKGILKQWGYDLKPGECYEIVGPDYDPSPM